MSPARDREAATPLPSARPGARIRADCGVRGPRLVGGLPREGSSCSRPRLGGGLRLWNGSAIDADGGSASTALVLK